MVVVGLKQAEPAQEAPPARRPMLEIGGVEYEIPSLETLDLDEEQILYEVGGVVQSDFMPAHPDSPEDVRLTVELAIGTRIRNPAFKRALAHIAYRRGNPDADFAAIELVIGKVNAFDAELALFGKAPEEDAGEPDPTESSEDES